MIKLIVELCAVDFCVADYTVLVTIRFSRLFRQCRQESAD